MPPRRGGICERYDLRFALCSTPGWIRLRDLVIVQGPRGVGVSVWARYPCSASAVGAIPSTVGAIPGVQGGLK